MKIGELIKEKRIKKGLTQKQLAELVGCAEITIRQYEKGSREPRLQIIESISRVLEIPSSNFFKKGYVDYLFEQTFLDENYFSLIKTMIKHKYFSKTQKNEILKLIETYINNIELYPDEQKAEMYKEAYQEIINRLLEMLIEQCTDTQLDNIIILITCFLALDNDEQMNIIEFLLDHCY